MSAITHYGDTQGTLEVDCEALVVGSGAGGAAVAAELAEAGLSVAVIEEGPLLGTDDYGADVSGMIGLLMRDAGTTVILGRQPIQYLEGRCVGGTTVINGGMCWRTPDKILDRWVREHGLRELTPKRLEPVFRRVEERINAREQDPGSEGGNNDVFKRGCDRVGFTVAVNRRNQVHCVGTADCVTGCPTGAKQSTLQSYIPHMLRHGGRLYTGCRVDRVTTSAGRATGVEGRIQNPHTGKHDRRFRATGRVVVLACGAIQTPLLLMRSRLARRGSHVGRNFTIHPNLKMVAMFEEDVMSLHGAHQAYQCTQLQDEGILLAPGGLPPALFALGAPGFGREHMAFMKQYRKIATGGILVDDHASGTVRRLPGGIPLVRYDVTDVDQQKFIRGAAALAEIYFAAGAKAILTGFHGVEPMRSMDDVRKLFDRPPRVEDTEYFTAHLMGTCRMDADPSRGVVSPTGESHEIRGLFITDASLLPTPIGVNPQETIMMLATLTAHHIAEQRQRLVG